jgi:REP element-mobilizing transposase RayT
LRKHRLSQSSGLYLVTKCLRKPHELSPLQRTEICDGFQAVRRLQWIYLHALVVMPDHWHALFNLGIANNEVDLGQAVRRINRWASFPSRMRGQRLVWKEEFHDHRVRAGESVVGIVRYIEANPVRKQLADSPTAWAWSSASEPWCHMLDRHFLGLERWDAE